MTRRITDPDVALLATLSTSVEADYAPDDLQWEGSPFVWIKSRPSRQIGAIGEKLVAGWCAARDLDVTRSPDSDADRVIGGRRCEIKFSTRWKSGVYKFQQIRDQDYEFAILLGVCPFDATPGSSPRRNCSQRRVEAAAVSRASTPAAKKPLGCPSPHTPRLHGLHPMAAHSPQRPN